MKFREFNTGDCVLKATSGSQCGGRQMIVIRLFVGFQIWRTWINIFWTQSSWRPTHVGGRRSKRIKTGVSPCVDGLRAISQSDTADRPSLLSCGVRFESSSGNCVPYSLFNVCSLPKKERSRILKQIGSRYTELNRLSSLQSKYWQLMKIDADISWLCQQTEGKFLVFQGTHCVGIDCGRNLVYDCEEDDSLSLGPRAFETCHFDMTRGFDIRQVLF